MNPRLTKRISLIVLTIVAALVLTAGGSVAASGTVSLKLKTDYRKQRVSACHKTKNFRLFHRGARIEFKGVVTPAPARHFPVRLELKRCVRGHWRDAGDRYTTGKKLTGKYKGFFSARPLAPRSHNRRAIVYLYARTIVNGIRSRRVFFAVTN
ncbi:MAG: hypothetical protein ACYC91_16620 [Solirubrobacteraceae bacterium]